MATIRTKSVSFNIDSEEELKLLEYANNKKNFSGYVKELIAADQRKKPAVIKTTGGGVNIRID
jgi:hypothetical protein